MKDDSREDVDMQYARGEMDREEYLRRVDSTTRPQASAARLRNWKRREFRGKRLVLALIVIVAVSVIFLVVMWPALVPPALFSTISLSSPRQISQSDVEVLDDSAGNILAFSSNNTVWVSGGTARIVARAAPPSHDETFQIGGLINPTVHVQRGSRVTVSLVNLDGGMYHNWALTTRSPPYSQMPMMQTGMTGPATTMLDPSSGGLYWAQDITFTVAASGEYWYLCTYVGHAAEGMYGSFVVT